MLEIEFNDQKISVPESWADLSLADYEKWFKHRPEGKMEYVHFIAGICKLDSEWLLHSPTQLFDAISEAVSFAFDTDFEPATRVNIDGRDFFISPSDELTLGEWIDVEETFNGDSETKISETLAIVCRPAGESYNPDTAAVRQETFRNLPCDKALPLLAFFCTKRKNQRRFRSIIQWWWLRQTGF